MHQYTSSGVIPVVKRSSVLQPTRYSRDGERAAGPVGAVVGGVIGGVVGGVAGVLGVDERPRFPAPDDDAPDLRQTRDRVIDDRLQIDCLPAPVRHVANDHHGRAGIIDTIA